jgi:cyanophycinase-like exopeptidase
MADEIDVLQDVLVLGVAIDDDAVVVDVYGSAVNVCGTVRIELPDRERRSAALRQLARWRRRDTPLTLIVRDSAIVLQDDHAAFGPQLTSSQP